MSLFRKQPVAEAIYGQRSECYAIDKVTASTGSECRFFGRLSAVLLENGQLIQTEREADVLGLVAIGRYRGLLFGDDGTFTARVASEPELQRTGVRHVEERLSEYLRISKPGYVAEHVSDLSQADAATFLDLAVRANQGVPLPDEVRLPSGGTQTIPTNVQA